MAAEQGPWGCCCTVRSCSPVSWRCSARPADTGAPGALVACFVAMVVHSLAYAGFLIDPVTWALLGVGLSLARGPLPSPLAERGAAHARAHARASPRAGCADAACC